jgi:hypothetical protein
MHRKGNTQLGQSQPTPLPASSVRPNNRAEPGGRLSGDRTLEPGRGCGWCGVSIVVAAGGRRLFCGRKCRQAHWRARQTELRDLAASSVKRFAYADPPYPGMSAKYYRDEPTYAGEVDHAALIATLRGYDGWALSTSEKTLRSVWQLCPEARCAAWIKTHPVSAQTFGPHNVWEPVLYVAGRRERPGVPDAIVAQVARGNGDLPGRKPRRFCQWLFALLGMCPGDVLDDLFPGTGIVGTTWAAIVAVSSERRRVSLIPGVDGAGGRRAAGNVAEGLERLECDGSSLGTAL